VGKTELALEYAHRFASDYDVDWWVPAELPTSATAVLAALAGRRGGPGYPELAVPCQPVRSSAASGVQCPV
jgi:hypothetical protein